jgi:hypothetical protein
VNLFSSWAILMILFGISTPHGRYHMMCLPLPGRYVFLMEDTSRLCLESVLLMEDTSLYCLESDLLVGDTCLPLTGESVLPLGNTHEIVWNQYSSWKIPHDVFTSSWWICSPHGRYLKIVFGILSPHGRYLIILFVISTPHGRYLMIVFTSTW